MPKKKRRYWPFADGNDTRQFWVSLGAFLVMGLLLAALSDSVLAVGAGVALICLANGYTITMLVLAARKKPYYIPNRAPALAILFFIFWSVLFAFACIYIGSKGVSVPGPLMVDMKTGALVSAGAGKLLADPAEALYFSLTTFTTFGSAYSQLSGWAEFAVAAELITGLNLLLMAFPILVSRLAMFDEPEFRTNRTYLRATREGGGVTESEDGSPAEDVIVIQVDQVLKPERIVLPSAATPAPVAAATTGSLEGGNSEKAKS